MSLASYGDCFLTHLDDQHQYSGYVQANGKNYVKVDGKGLKHPLSDVNKLDNIVNISLREKVAGSTAFDTFRLYDIVNGELWFVADVGDNNYYNIFLLHLPKVLGELTSTVAVNSTETVDETQNTSISGLDTRITTLENTIVSGLTAEQLGYIADVPTLKTEMDAVEAKNGAQDAEIVVVNAGLTVVNQRVDATNLVVANNTTNIATLMGAGSDYNFDARIDAIETVVPNIATNTTAINLIPSATQTFTNKTIDVSFGTGNTIANLVNANIKASAGIVYEKLSIADDDIPQAKVNGLTNALNGVSASSTQTLTNKTIDADGAGNNITNLDNDNIKASAGIVYEKLLIADGDLTQAKVSGLGTALGEKSTASKTETLTNKTIDAVVNSIANLDNDNIIASAGIVYSKLSIADSDIPQGKINGLATAFADKANLNAPSFTGTVSGITSAMVGLGNVDNTSDANKPISTAQGIKNTSQDGFITANTAKRGVSKPCVFYEAIASGATPADIASGSFVKRDLNNSDSDNNTYFTLAGGVMTCALAGDYYVNFNTIVASGLNVMSRFRRTTALNEFNIISTIGYSANAEIGTNEGYGIFTASVGDTFEVQTRVSGVSATVGIDAGFGEANVFTFVSLERC